MQNKISSNLKMWWCKSNDCFHFYI